MLRTVGLYRPSAAERISEFRADVLAKKVSLHLPPRTRVDTVKVDSTKNLTEKQFADLSFIVENGTFDDWQKAIATPTTAVQSDQADQSAGPMFEDYVGGNDDVE